MLNVPIYDWKNYLTHLYRKASSQLKLFTAQSYQFQSEKSAIECRSNDQGEPMFVKLLKRAKEPVPEFDKVQIEDVEEGRMEELKKVKKFITPEKRQDFWKGVR